jgi:protein TonB
MVADNRPFHYAIAASLVLHALLLFGLPDLIDTARRVVSSPPPILARLMEPEPAAPPQAPPPETKKVEPAKPVPRIAKPAPQKVLPEVKTEDVAAPAPQVAEPVPAPPPPVAAVAPQATSPAVQAPAPAAPGPAPETVSRDQYRVQLIDEARRHKRYPPIARENNWQGDVRIGVAIGANGRPSVTLKGSSGYDVLDRQAVEMFMQAARAVPIPPALRGKEFALEVRAVYGLED